MSALSDIYRQGKILNINTAKNDINKLISAAKPKAVLTDSSIKSIKTHPVVLRTHEKRLDKVSRSIERVLRNKEMNRFKTVIVNFLLFKPVGDDYDFCKPRGNVGTNIPTGACGRKSVVSIKSQSVLMSRTSKRYTCD